VACHSAAANPSHFPAATSKDGTLAQNVPEVAVTVDDLPTHGPPPPGFDRMAIAEHLLSAFD